MAKCTSRSPCSSYIHSADFFILLISEITIHSYSRPDQDRRRSQEGRPRSRTGVHRLCRADERDDGHAGSCRGRVLREGAGESIASAPPSSPEQPAFGGLPVPDHESSSLLDSVIFPADRLCQSTIPCDPSSPGSFPG